MKISTLNGLERDSILIFNHVPKAGGTSLINFFKELYGADKCYRHRGRNPSDDSYSPALETISAEDREKLRFTAGHMAHGKHTLFPGRPYLYLGVVRDPIDRIISDYYYNRTAGRPDLKELTNKLSLSEYLKHKIDSGKSDLVRSSQILKVTGEKDLKKAKAVLEDEFFICCTIKQLNRAQSLMADFFGMETAPIRVNKSSKKPRTAESELSKADIDTLKKACKVDIQFVEMIDKMFEASAKKYAKTPVGERDATIFKFDLLKAPIHT